MPTRATSLGWRGEAAARAWLEKRGLIFVAAHFRTRLGEIDLIMRQGSTTVFVEVKVRRNRLFGSPEESISQKKIEKLAATIEVYCREHPEVGEVRLDAVLIEGVSPTWTFRHLQNIG